MKKIPVKLYKIQAESCSESQDQYCQCTCPPNYYCVDGRKPTTIIYSTQYFRIGICNSLFVQEGDLCNQTVNLFCAPGLVCMEEGTTGVSYCATIPLGTPCNISDAYCEETTEVW